MTPPLDGPLVCKPAGSLPLRDVPGFPADCARTVAAQHGLTTLVQLLEWSFGQRPPAKWDAGAARTVAATLTNCRADAADADLAGRAVVALLTLQPPPKPEACDADRGAGAAGAGSLRPGGDGPGAVAPGAAGGGVHGGRPGVGLGRPGDDRGA